MSKIKGPTIKGKHSISEAIQSNQAIQRIIISSQTQSHPEIRKIIQLSKQKKIQIKIIKKDIFEKDYPEKNSQGIIAILNTPNTKSLQDILNSKNKPRVIVALDHLEDPFNLGSIIRTCETLGVTCVLYPKDRNVQITSGVIKASSGAIHHIDLIKVTNIAQSILELKKSGYWVYGTGETKSINLNNFSPASPFILVVGNEHKGMSKRLEKIVDENIRIPLQGNVTSLNVSVATGICLYTLLNKLDH